MADLQDMTPEERCAFWAKDRAEATRRERERKPTDKVGKLMHDATTNASIWSEQDGLYPKSYGEWNEPRYDVQQGLRAAHVGREDSAATLLLMRPVLEHLDVIIKLLWIMVVMLVVILWRVW